MSKGQVKFQSGKRVGAHILREEPTAVLYHGPDATCIHFGKFMLDRAKPAGPRPSLPKK